MVFLRDEDTKCRSEESTKKLLEAFSDEYGKIQVNMVGIRG